MPTACRAQAPLWKGLVARLEPALRQAQLSHLRAQSKAALLLQKTADGSQSPEHHHPGSAPRHTWVPRTSLPCQSSGGSKPEKGDLPARTFGWMGRVLPQPARDAGLSSPRTLPCSCTSQHTSQRSSLPSSLPGATWSSLRVFLTPSSLQLPRAAPTGDHGRGLRAAEPVYSPSAA